MSSELAAAYPTAAGVHHWVYQLAASGQKSFLTWMTGWLTMIGAIASASSIAFYFSSILGQVLYSIHKVAFTPGILVMFYLGALLFWQLFNLLPVRGLGYVSTFSVIGLNYGILQPIKGLLDEAVPAVRVILVTLDETLGMTVMSLTLVGIFFTGLARLSLATRVAYAFSRDAGLPKSSYWNHLHARRKTPQRVSWLVTIACMSGIFPFYWGDNNAFHWIASLSCVATNLSFVIPFWMMLTREGSYNHTPGPFGTGVFSRSLYTVSVLWLLFLSAVLMLPTTFPLTRGNFNYAPAAIGGAMFLAAVSWFKARYSFTGAAKEGSRAIHRASSLSYHRSSRAPSSFSQQHHHDLDYGFQRHNRVSPISQSSRSEHLGLRTPRSPGSTHTYTKSSHVNCAASMVSESEYGASRGCDKSLKIRDTEELGQSDGRRSLTPLHRTNSDSKALTQSSHSHPASHRSSHTSGQHSQHTKSSLTTVVTHTSSQSHPHSVLGGPLCSSPELVPQEVQTKKTLSTLSSPRQLSQNDSRAYGIERIDSGNAVLSPALAAESAPVPEISIAPPTTVSSLEARTDSQLSTSTCDKNTIPEKDKGESTYQQDRHSAPTISPISSPLPRPLTATESIFPELTLTGTVCSSSSSSRLAATGGTENHDDDYFSKSRTGMSSPSSPSPRSPRSPRKLSKLSDNMERTMQDLRITRPKRPQLERRNAEYNSSPHTPGSDATDDASNMCDLTVRSLNGGLKIMGMDVDDSFDEEYHNQYPVISAFKSTQNLFNLPATIITVRDTQAPLLFSDGWPLPSTDDGVSTLSALRSRESESLVRLQGDDHERDVKNQVVARWAEEQGKIHERRMVKKRAMACHGRQSERAVSSSGTTSESTAIVAERARSKAGTNVLLPGSAKTRESNAPLEVLLEERGVEIPQDNGHILERVDTLGAGVGKP
ncbi:hypothetical protein BGZ98_009782 [Dissophora globulifera]|nr:hypothetical protein BGZ98_009782 [Dissophora globulifera]